MPQEAKKRLVDAFNQELADDHTQELRERVAFEIPTSLATNGLRLLMHHELEQQPAPGVGFATATLMAAELGDGAQRLYGAGLWYPGAALVRQLIECGYLLTLMSESRDEAATWMTSSHDDIVKRFSFGLKLNGLPPTETRLLLAPASSKTLTLKPSASRTTDWPRTYCASRS